MKRKVILAILAAALMMSLCACTGDGSGDSESGTTGGIQAPSTTKEKIETPPTKKDGETQPPVEYEGDGSGAVYTGEGLPPGAVVDYEEEFEVDENDPDMNGKRFRREG